jgi:hypothetical protein
MHGMYLDALSYLEDERDTYRPFEALLELSDAQLEVPVAAAGGWSGRDLMGHILHGQEAALASAKELAVGETSPTLDRMEAAWASGPEAGDRINAEALERYGAMPLADLRARFREVAGDLRGYLTVVPESRWIKHAAHQEYFFGETTEHYEEHQKELAAILEAVR